MQTLIIEMHFNPTGWLQVSAPLSSKSITLSYHVDADSSMVLVTQDVCFKSFGLSCSFTMVGVLFFCGTVNCYSNSSTVSQHGSTFHWQLCTAVKESHIVTKNLTRSRTFTLFSLCKPYTLKISQSCQVLLEFILFSMASLSTRSFKMSIFNPLSL